MSGSIDLASLTDRELMALHAATIDKLIERGTVRTRNAPTGDYAEFLISAAFDGQLAANSAKGISWKVYADDALLDEHRCTDITDRIQRVQCPDPTVPNRRSP